MMNNMLNKIWVILVLLSSSNLFGQSCPTYTNSLPISTGYNYQNGLYFSNGSNDPSYIITADYVNSTSEPRQTIVTYTPIQANNFNYTYVVAPYYNTASTAQTLLPFTIEYKFCLSQINNLNLNLFVAGDDLVKVYLNGNLLNGSINVNGSLVSVTNQSFFSIGNNVIKFELYDVGFSVNWLYVNGTLTSNSNSIFYPTCNGSNTNLLYNDNAYPISNIPAINVCTNQKVNLGVSNNTYSWSWDFGDATADNGVSVSHIYTAPGNYKVTVYPQTSACFLLNPITFNINVTDCPLPQCDKCISSFAPTPGDYIVSCWVKEDRTSPVTTYANTGIKLSFNGDPIMYGPFFPNVSKNKIIEGWQRIEEKFTVPPGATDLKIALVNNSSSTSSPVDSYFDDIRIFPLDGSMKSYVYDPINLRLVAELDENNYATIYEYDEEGKLIRVKKETEKGIMTIKETRSAKRKQ